jgi:molecular chaperone Hsp33
MIFIARCATVRGVTSSTDLWRDRRDVAVRAMTDDGSFRAVAVDVTQTARDAIAAQRATGLDAAHFAQLIAGAVLFRETMAPDQRVQCVLHGSADSGRLVVDAQPEGRTRGLIARRGGAGEVLLGPGARLEMLRTLPNQRGYRGVVEVPAGGSITVAVMEYLQTSEQIVSMVAIAAPFTEDGELVRAMGYLLQLTPETRRGPLEVMTLRLQDFQSITAQAMDPAQSPTTLVEELLYGMDYAVTSEVPVEFSCGCDGTKVLASIASLSRADLEDLLSTGEPIELNCDYCTRSYVVTPAQLRGLSRRS